MQTHEALQRFIGIAGDLRASAVRLTGRHHPVFREVALRQPDVGGSPELAFIQAVSWLYVHYVEAEAARPESSQEAGGELYFSS